MSGDDETMGSADPATGWLGLNARQLGSDTKLQPLSGFDAAFLAAETPGNPLHVMAILVLDPATLPGGYSFERMRQFLSERMHLIPPMRRRLVEVPFGLMGCEERLPDLQPLAELLSTSLEALAKAVDQRGR